MVGDLTKNVFWYNPVNIPSFVIVLHDILIYSVNTAYDSTQAYTLYKSYYCQTNTPSTVNFSGKNISSHYLFVNVKKLHFTSILKTPQCNTRGQTWIVLFQCSVLNEPQWFAKTIM